MKNLLVAVNAKYIHSNLAVLSLRAYAAQKGLQVDVVEYTVNQNVDGVISDIYGKEPEWVGFSCYIWNIEMVKTIAKTLRIIMPNVSIWFGGPEVTYGVKELLTQLPYVDGVIMGEGEETLVKLLNHMGKESELEEVDGIAYRDDGGSVHVNPPADPVSMDDLPFPYEEEDDYKNRILYYESSRGCPFSCSYCLSSLEKSVRFRSLDKVRKELAYFLSKEVNQVKFVDRTFNMNPERTRRIWEFIRDNDNGVTNFHFEISADLLDEENYKQLSTMRKGLVQLEIGVQSTNMDAVRAVHRKMDLERLETSVKKVKEGGNIHQHLDLIVGLPYEGYESVRKSFHDVYRMKPEQIQMGFLKVLKGSPIREEAPEYGILYREYPPYEVLSTKWLPYSETIRLKQVEEMVEVYYNSGQFTMSLSYLERFYENPFDLFYSLGEYYRMHYDKLGSHSRIHRYETLLEFYKQTFRKEEAAFSQLLLCDLYLRENVKKRPAFAGEEDARSKREFYENKENLDRYLSNYKGYDRRQIARMTHFERFFVDIFSMAGGEGVAYRDTDVLFDYKERDPLTANARMKKII